MTVHIWIIGMLCSGSLSDIKTKSISYRFLAVAGTGSLIVALLTSAPASVLEGMIPGLFVYVFSKLSGGALGAGDALAIIFTGMSAGLDSTCLLLMISLLIICPLGIILCATGHAGRNTRLPFYPFLSLSYLCCVLIEYLGNGGGRP